MVTAVPEDSTPPVSERARTLLQGAFDTHVHISPDVVPRRIDDLTLARRFAERGLAGFVLKSHYTSTAERASVVSAAAPENVQVLGAITLNRAVGGMNAVAVEIAAREGARTVWFPTVDSANESGEETAFPPGAKVPVWMELQRELRAAGVGIEPVPVVDESGAVLPETRTVLAAIARHGLVLATGHLARDEIFAVVDAARRGRACGDIVITHPDFPSQSLVGRGSAALAERGALLERCFTTPHTGKSTWEQDLRRDPRDRRRALGALDGPRPDREPAGRGWSGLMADRLLAAGFAEDEVHTMAVGNTRRLAGGPPYEPAPARHRCALGRLRVAGRRRRRGRRPRAGGSGAGDRALLRRAGRVGGAVEGARGRRSRTSRRSGTRRPSGPPGAGCRVPVPRPRRLPAGDRCASAAALADEIREFAPDVLVTHTDKDPFNPDHADRRARPSIAPARWPPAPGCRARSRRSRRPSCSSSSRTSPSCAASCRRRSSTSPRSSRQKLAAMAEMKAQEYLRTYYAERAEHRGNHARRASGRSEIQLRRGVPARDPAGGRRAVSGLGGARGARLRDGLRGRGPPGLVDACSTRSCPVPASPALRGPCAAGRTTT